MTLEITQAGSLALGKTHRSLCKDRLWKRGRSATECFSHSSSQSLSWGQFLHEKDVARFGVKG